MRRRAAVAKLSPRERRVLRLLAQGKSTQECAKELGVGFDTISTYIRRAKKKLHARTRVHAIAEAIRGGLLEE